MADTTTAVYQFVLPEVGASDDTWGTKLNADLQKLENIFAARWGGGSSTSLGTYWKANQKLQFAGAKNVALANASGQTEGSFGIDADAGAAGATGNVFLQKNNPTSGAALARLRLEPDGAINASVGFFKGSAAGLTGIPEAALPANLTPTSVIASGAVHGILRHLSSYFHINSFNTATYGTGAARLWWSQNDHELTFVSEDGGAANLKTTGNVKTGGLLTLVDTNVNIVFNDTDAASIAGISGNSGQIRFSEVNSTGGIVDLFATISSAGITLSGGEFTGSGAGLTSVPAGQLTGTVSASRLPTDANADNWVAERNADLSGGGIGTYRWLLGTASGDTSGDNVSGSNLRTPNLQVNISSTNMDMSYGGGPSGTWQAMQTTTCAADEICAGVWMRVL